MRFVTTLYSVTTSFNVQRSTAMSSAFPFDIIALIIDTVRENNDAYLLKKLALVSHSFHQICSKHLFATIELHDVGKNHRIASPLKRFVELLGSRPDIAKYIRKVTYICNNMFQFFPTLQVSSTTTIVYSHPAFQISLEQFFTSIASRSPLHSSTGIHLTLP